MDMDEMIEIEGVDSKKTLFSNLIKVKNKILLWQNIDNIHRVKKEVQFNKFDSNKLELSFFPRTGLFNFDAKLPVYFWCHKRTTIFKNNIFFNSNYNLVLKIPEILFLENIRKTSREHPQGEFVTILHGSDNFNRSAWVKARLMDRSPGGISFQSSMGSTTKYKQGQQIEFKLQRMSEFVKGEIVNVSTVLVGKTKIKRVCVKVLSIL